MGTALLTWLILGYALLVAGGGLMGYAKARSQASLISGVGSGVALLLVWWLSWQNPKVGLALAACIALGLTVVFSLRYRKTGKFIPAGLLALFSFGAFGLFLYGWLS